VRTTRSIVRLARTWRHTAQVRSGWRSGRRFGIFRALSGGLSHARSTGAGSRNAGVGPNVDSPTGQLGRQAGILPLASDGQ
jgi:hypothetical protein